MTNAPLAILRRDEAVRAQRREDGANRCPGLKVGGGAARRRRDRRLPGADDLHSIDVDLRAAQLADLPRPAPENGNAAAGPDDRAEASTGVTKRQPPLVNAASLLAWPAQAPVGLAPTM